MNFLIFTKLVPGPVLLFSNLRMRVLLPAKQMRSLLALNAYCFNLSVADVVCKPYAIQKFLATGKALSYLFYFVPKEHRVYSKG